MKFRIFLATILSLYTGAAIMAQVPSGSKVLNYPNEYYKPDGKILPKSEGTSGSDWVAYGDRDNIPTYSKPDGKSAFKTLNFLEACYVIEEKGDYLHLVKHDPSIFLSSSKTARKIAPTAVDMGWVEKKQLLLWKHALVSSQGFTIKALAISNDKNALLNPGKYIRDGNVVRIYNSPDLHDENKNGIFLFQFLFIYKTSDDGKNYLIGKTYQTNASSIRAELLGWVPSGIVQRWEQRLCLEPNWDKAAADERLNTGIKATLWQNEVEVLSVMKGNKVQGIWNEDPYSVRFAPEWKRFPVLQKFPNNILETGLITNIFDKTGATAVKTSEQLAVEKKYNDLRPKIRSINIVFVMDGGSSMNGYYEPIINSIKKTLNYASEDSKNKFRFGGVIYRDYSEEKCPTKKRDVEVLDLTPNISPVIDFFNEASIDTKDCFDKEKPQAVYLGVNKALRMMADHKDETNMIILIGNDGNRKGDPKGFTDEAVAKLVAETETRLLVFQVNNANDKSYDDFLRQARALITSSAKTIADNVRKRDPKIAGKVVEPEFDQVDDKNIYQLKYPVTSPIPGMVLFADKGNPMATSYLESSISSFIQQANEGIEARLSELDAQLSGVGERSEKKLNAAVIYYLSKLGTDINNEEVIRKYTDDNYQFFIKAYTTLDVKNMQYPLYKYILFVDEDEYTDLKKALEAVVINETGSQLREKLVDVYKELILKYVGDRNEKEVLNTHLSAVLEKVTGIPSRSEFLKKYSIADLENRKVVTDAQLLQLMDYMKNKLNLLKSIRNDDKSFFDNNDLRYYWLPENILP
jgi:hypothetical protein